MKKAFVFLVLINLATACAPGDRTLMNGEWTLSELRVNGRLEYASDPDKRSRIADSLFHNDKQYISEADGITEKYLRERIDRRINQAGQITLEIRKDKTYTMTRTYYGQTQTLEGTTITDESKKELYMNGDVPKVYIYEVNAKELKLIEKGDYQNRQVIFRRN